MVEENIIEEKVKEKFPKAVLDVKTFKDELTLCIGKDYIENIAGLTFAHSQKRQILESSGKGK